MQDADNQKQTGFEKTYGGYWLALALIVLVAGIAGAVYMGKYEDGRLRSSLIDRAQTIAAGVHTDELETLAGGQQDLSTEAYQKNKASLIKIRKVNNDARFVYLMGFRSGQLFFYADSEPADSQDYSPPGQIYAEASSEKIKNAAGGVSFAEGPYTDRWGTWVSGYAPVFSQRGTILATAGIDITATAWKQAIAFARALPIGITFFIILIIGLLYRARRRQAIFIRTINADAKEIEIQEQRLQALYEITTHTDLSVADQLRQAVKVGASSLHTKLGVLSHITDEMFTVLHCYDAEGGLKEGDTFKLAETYCDITVKNKDVVAIDQMKTSSFQAHACYTKFKLESYIGVPVLVNGELFGTLAFLAPGPHHPGFNDSDRDFVRLMGKWVSATLEVARVREQEKEINKMKSEFVSVASHQLRTPLTGIKWFGELLLKGKAGKLSKDQQDFIQQMYDSNDRMIALVEDLLNVSRIETGKKFTIAKKPTDVIPIIDSLATDLIGLAQAHKVTITRASDFPKTLTLSIDGDKIRQVFQNLMSNAIKYSKEGGLVEIGCTTDSLSPSGRGSPLERDKQGEGFVAFSVKDTGLGIPEVAQKRMFEKFFRADNVQTKETDGTGLGLYIAKAIIEGHNGKIWFESKENIGTIFYFSLPK